MSHSIPARPRELGPLNHDDFLAAVTERYEPAVIRGAVADWSIVEAARISDAALVDYLLEFDAGASANLVISEPAAEGRLTYGGSMTELNFRRERVPVASGLRQMVTRSDASGDPQLCFQSLRVPRVFPGLEKALPNPHLPSEIPGNIWIGSRVVVPAHFDDASNVAFVAAGRRRVTLFPPEQVANLYVGRLDFTPAGQPVSLVDPNRPDLQRFPRFAAAWEQAFQVDLEPGDAIYIPTPWWHHIESLDSLNILVNFFWSNTGVPSATPFGLLIHAIQALKHLPEPERAAWRSLLEHYIFESNGDPVEHFGGEDAGILGPMNPALRQHLHQWLLNQFGQGPGRQS